MSDQPASEPTNLAQAVGRVISELRRLDRLQSDVGAMRSELRLIDGSLARHESRLSSIEATLSRHGDMLTEIRDMARDLLSMAHRHEEAV